MKTLSVRAIVKESWAKFKAEKKGILIASLAFLIVVNLGNLVPKHSPMLIRGGSNIILTILSTIFSIWFIKTLLKVIDGGKPDFQYLKQIRFRIFWRYFFGSVLYFVVAGAPAMILGFFAVTSFASGLWVLAFLLGLGAVVYGVYMSLRYLLVPYVLVDDEQISIGRAFKKTAHLTDGVKWKLAQLLIISIIINMIGSIPASIGLLISLPISYLALLIAYRKLLKA